MLFPLDHESDSDNQNFHLFHVSKGSTIDRTNDIVRSLRVDDESRPHTKNNKDVYRLAQLYGYGLHRIKKLKGNKHGLFGDDRDFESDETDLVSAMSKIDSCTNLGDGMDRLESLSSRTISIGELMNIMELQFGLHLSVQECAAVAKRFDSVQGRGFNTCINFIKFLPALKKYAESLRSEDRRRRLKEREDTHKAERARLEALVPKGEMPEELGLLTLSTALAKLSQACRHMWENEKRTMAKLCKTETSGGLDIAALRDFCRRHLNLKLTIDEAGAIIVRADHIGCGSVPVGYFLAQIKLLGLGRKSDLSPLEIAVLKPADTPHTASSAGLIGGLSNESNKFEVSESVSESVSVCTIACGGGRSSMHIARAF